MFVYMDVYLVCDRRRTSKREEKNRQKEREKERKRDGMLRMMGITLKDADGWLNGNANDESK